MTKYQFSVQFYQERIQLLTVDLHKYTSFARMWIFIRLFTFLGIVGLAYFAFPYGGYSVFGLFLLIISFLVFIRKSVENAERLDYVKKLISINENEIEAAQMNFSRFKNGEQFANNEHPFSYDIDIFGNGCFFPFFNRTATKKGEEKLADYFLNGRLSEEQRHTSIEAVDELVNHKEWYQEYLAHGMITETEIENISLELLQKQNIKVNSRDKWMQYVLPVFTISLSVLFYFDYLNGVQFIVFALLLMLPILLQLKKTKTLHKTLSIVGKRTTAMRNQMAIMEEKYFSSTVLKSFQRQLFQENKNAKQGLIQLSKLVKEAEFRDNALVAICLNFFLAWDLRLLISSDKWLKNYGDLVNRWEDILLEIEVLISGANFRYNFQQQTSIPALTKKETAIQITQIGHPLIPQEKLVKNDFSLTENQQFAIITGPNMAGKSTFLRSVGINLMLARAGFHVFAEQFIFPDSRLYSSMRTNDNLRNETSYFHAELLRLRLIVDAIEKGEKVFIILDEILKGTNSKDKEEGSSKFLQKLIQLQTKGIIATHDLSLTHLASIEKSIVNQYFDTQIESENISFDYQIKKGVAQNMNANFLLKRMGLID